MFKMFKMLSWSASISVLAVADAREISFPSVSGFTSDQAVMGAITPDIHQMKFGGLSTYANLPYVHCLAADSEDVEKFDIAILGAPFDTVSHRQFSRPTELGCWGRWMLCHPLL
jgi:agmatinase